MLAVFKPRPPSSIYSLHSLFLTFKNILIQKYLDMQKPVFTLASLKILESPVG
jgi:hypothetical protein